ncbi:ferrioxamine B transporter, partial [Coemansia sp. RSA 2708]
MSLVESADQPKWPTLAMVRKQLTAELSLADKILLSASLFCINFVAALDISAIGTVQPRVLSDFNAMTKVGAITVIMILLSAGIRPVFAKITETFGHLEALIVSVMFHVLGSLICALAKNFGAIFAGTVFSWLGQTGYSTLVALLVADTLPIHLRASVTAYISIPFVTNYYLGIEIANQLYDKWQWVYGILCILAFVCALPA